AAARLLSVCCCPGCGARWSAAGANPEEVRARLRAEVRDLIDGGDLDGGGLDTADRLPAGLGELLLRTRQAATDELRAGVLAAVSAGPASVGASGARIVLHAAVDPWVTGALPGLTPACADQVDSVVLQCWAPGADAVSAVARGRAELPAQVAVGSYVTAVGAAPVPDLAGYVAELGEAGAGELHLYHLGLAGPARRSDLAAAVAGARRARSWAAETSAAR
ncbi:MAG TPA: hypothetical protein VNP03_22610, partial [Pseudonocardia sp.]|nr:hypothetical protein [Pseudonocardia sp.]